MKSKNLPVLVAGILLAVILTACGDNTSTSASVSTTAAAGATTAAMTSASATTAMAAMTTPAATTAMAAMTTPAATTAMAAMTTAAMTSMPSMTTAAMSSMPSMTTAAMAGGKPNEITIQDFKFGPETLTIPVGTKVTWTNKDSSAHTVTSDEGTVLKSDLIPQNGKFEFTFDKAGTYTYHCQPHPFMKATIIVK